MSVDSRIPLGFDNSQIFDPVEAKAKQLKLQEMQQGVQRGQFEQQMQPYEMRKAQMAEQLNNIKLYAEKNDAALALLQQAQNPDAYTAARQKAIQMGLASEQEIPDQFDPNWVFNARKAHLSAKDQLDEIYRNSALQMQKENLALQRQDRAADNNRMNRQLDIQERHYKALEDAARAKNGLMLDPDTNEIVQNPDASPKKILPDSGKKRLLENLQSFKQADRALALLQGKNIGDAVGDTDAVGFKGMLPESLLQRVYPEGVDTRAAIADLGSLVIHDRSGAAVTAAEFPRLKPFIPKETDNVETAKKKLKRFVSVYREVMQDTADFYKELGYKVPEIDLSGRSDSDLSFSAPDQKNMNSGGWSIEAVE